MGGLDPMESWTYGPLSRTDIVRYQGASGDFNPIHHDDDFAQASGYPTAFSVGMLQAGLLATFAVRRYGKQNLRRFKVRFRGMVWPGDILTFSGQPMAVDGDSSRLRIELSCTRQDGTVAVTGVAEFVASA